MAAPKKDDFVGPTQAPTRDPNYFVGPPQAQPWDNWNDSQHASAAKLLELLNGIKLYQSAGGAGVGTEYAKHAQDLAARGGLSPEEATMLARYRMSKVEGVGPIPNGARAPADSDATINARRDELLAAPADKRGGMMAEQKAAGYLTNEGFFDTLARKPAPQMVKEQPITLAPAPAPQTAALPTVGDSATDDEKLSNAQLMLLYKLAGAAH